MIRFNNIAYVAFVLSILLSSALIAGVSHASDITYRAELTPFPKSLTWQQRIPVEGGPIGVDLEATINPGTITAEVSGKIQIDTDTGIMSVHGTRTKLSSEGDAVLKGNITLDFIAPLSEAFFGENKDYHIKQEIEIPGLDKKSWNRSDTYGRSASDKPLLLGYGDSFKLYIPDVQLGATGLGTAEIVTVVASTALNGGDLTGAAKVFIENLSDYLDARVNLYATLSIQPTLSGKSVTVKGTTVNYPGDSVNSEGTKEIKDEGIPIRAPNFRRPHVSKRKEFNISKVGYNIETNYDAEITYTLGIRVSTYAHANVSICGGIEIWSYTKPTDNGQRFPVLSEQTFDLDFSDAGMSVPYLRSVGTEGDRELAKGVIPDKELARRVRIALGLDSNDPPLSADDMLELKTLRAGAVSIRGLEYAVNLIELDLSSGLISDVSPLSTLTNLRTLNLAWNPISELSLSGLTNLTELILGGGGLRSASSKVSLSDLPNLTKLQLGPLFRELSLSNLPKLELSGITHLKNGFKLSVSDLPQITTLDFTDHSISEVSLSDMPQLTTLTFYDNNISEVSLSGMPRLSELRFFSNNNISELSLSGTPQLTELRLDDNNISELSLPDLPQLTTLDIRHTNLPALSLPDLPQLTALTLMGNNFVTVSELSLPDMPQLATLRLQDNNLSALSLPDLPQLTTLALRDNNLSALSLPDLPQLTTLDLYANNLSTLSLPEMRQLTTLTLSGQSISEVSLSDMPQLTTLTFNGDNLPDISEFQRLTQLTTLVLNGHSISEVSLSDMPQLTTLELRGNSISEISLSDMPHLTTSELRGHSISEVSLSGLPQITTLQLQDTKLSALSLSDMPQLTTLDLSSTNISDILFLLELPNLQKLNLRNTPLNYISRNTYIPALREKGVSVEFDGRSANLDKISGDEQIGVRNTELPLPLVVQALDWRDDPIPDVPIKFVIYQGEGTLSTTTTTTDATGKAETRLTFGSEPGEIKVGVIAASPELKTSLSFTAKCGDEDVDRDGIVNIQDLVQVAANLGETDGHPADVNCDGVVNSIDLTLVAAAFGEVATTPATHTAVLENFTAAEVAQWIQEAQNATPKNPASRGVSQPGIEVLKNLLTLFVDVNRDGTVNIQDLVQVGANLGATGENPADVNGDGVVNIIDLTLVADAFRKTAAAPTAHATSVENLTATEVAQWIQAAQNANLTDPTFQRGIEVLKNLLTLLVPKETVLLANYPNPFNPETWIPYQLAAPAKVTLRIHAVDGSLVRMLSLGHRPVGIYQTRSRAAYWNGRNQLGEPVASGVYFYTLTAGDFTATRKMLIRK